jgi:hypothetical protein
MLDKVLTEGAHGLVVSAETKIEAMRQDYESDFREFHLAPTLLSNVFKSEAKEAECVLANAIFLSIYAVFELSVLRIIEEYLEVKGINLRLRDIAGSGIEKFRVVSDRLASKSHVDKVLWTEAEHLREIRNALVHSNGIILEKGKLLKIIKSLEVLDASDLALSTGEQISEVKLSVSFVRAVRWKVSKLVNSAYCILLKEMDHANL